MFSLPARLRAYITQSARPDLVAGLTVAMVVLPQSMAYAAIAGINPIYGIYTAIIPAIFGPLFGSSRVLVTGPTNATALVVLSVLAGFSDDPARYLELVFALALMVGAIKLALGLLRLGSLVRYVSNSVLTGFLTAAGILISIDQLGNLLGLRLPKDLGIVAILSETARKLGEISLPTLLTAATGIAIMLVMRRYLKKLPAALIAIVACAVLVQLAGWGSGAVRLISGLGLPAQPGISLHFPQVDAQDWLDLLPAAGAVALFSLVEALSISRALGLASGEQPDSSREFIGQGLAALAGGLTQCMPPSGSPSRSAVNLRAGARTRLAAASSGGFVWLTLALFAPWIGAIPLPGLAAVVVVSALGLVDTRQIALTWRTRPASRLVMAVTFAAALFLQLHYAIYLGMALSIGIYLYESSRLRLRYLVFDEHGRVAEKSMDELYAAPPPVAVINVEGDLYFGAVRDLEEAVARCRTCGLRALVLRLRSMHNLASTGVTALAWAIRNSQKAGMTVLLSGVDPAMGRILAAGGIIDLVGAENVFVCEETLFEATLAAYQKAQTL
jgi:sulfate permease, SulP family